MSAAAAGELEAAACGSCEGPVDPFLARESGLVLHRTLRLELGGRKWGKVRMSMNDRMHHYERDRRNKVWLQLARDAAANVPALDWARVLVFYRFPTAHRRDVHNLMPTSKAIVDGLVKAGVLPDDQDEYLVGPDNRREPVNGPHQVVVRIYRRA